jgi:hypothetical protein
MKRLLLCAIVAFFSTTTAWSQALELVVETVNSDIGVIADFDGDVDLTGYATYRVYVKYSSEEDFLTAVYGDSNFPTIIHGGNNFYQHPVGGLTAALVQSTLFPVYPALEYDSYVTVGMTGPADAGAGEASINTIGDPAANWAPVFDPGAGATGGDIVINTQTGGSWFPLFPDANAYAGADSLVLIGQFTTDTVLWGQVSVASFVGGSQGADTLQTFPFSSVPDAIFGCVDMDAVNYNSSATNDDGTCYYLCDYPGTMLVITGSSSSDVSCFGGADGSVSLSVTGGQGSLSYSDGVTNNATGVFSTQFAGEVTVTVTDNQGCTASETLTVSSPDALVLDATLSSPVSCNGLTDAVISGGATGGMGVLSYSLDEDFMVASAELNFEGVGPGLFTVYVQDENGCEANSPAILVENPAQFVLYASAVLGTNCPGSDDGNIVLNYYGGSGSSTTFSLDGIAYQETGNFLVSAGTYTGYGMDVNGCIDSVDSIVVATPSDFVAQTISTEPTCNGGADGSMTVEIQGGTGDLLYAYMGDTTLTWSMADLAAGVYTIGVLDENGCSGSLDVELAEPVAIALAGTVIDVLCNGDANGSVELAANGGDGDFVYMVEGGTFGPGTSFTDLAAGDYNFTVQDGASCATTEAITVGEPDALSIVVDVNDGASGSASDAVVDVTVSGGTMPYTYSWTGADAFTADTEDLADIAAGDYTLTVTDGNGCELVGDAVVVVSGVGELAHIVNIELFPNPNSGFFQVNVTGLAGERVVSKLVDATGRVISKEAWGALNGEASRNMDLSTTAAGLYFLHMQIGAQSRTLRVVKH